MAKKTKVNVDALKAVSVKYMSEYKTCPTCKGTGISTSNIDKPCTTCNGDGIVIKDKKR